MNDKKTWEEQYDKAWDTEWERNVSMDGDNEPVLITDKTKVKSFISSVEASAYRRGLNRAVEEIDRQIADAHDDGFKAGRYEINSEEWKEELVKHMVNRFLGWKLPNDFSPDCGISFTKLSNMEPVGTNLLTAAQTKEMFKYLLKDFARYLPDEGLDNK